MSQSAEENKQTKNQNRDEFDEAWEELEGQADGKAEASAPPDEGKEVTKKPDEPGVQPAPKEATDVSQQPYQEPPQQSAQSEEVRRLMEELEKERQRTRSWEGRIRAANERAKRAEEELARLLEGRDKPKGVEQAPAKVPQDPDEEAALKAFTEEFPDLPKPIIALVKREIVPLIQGMVQAELAKIEPVVKEVEVIKERIQSDTVESHVRAITSAHPDWEQIVSSGELDKFIDSQPSYVRRALNHVKEAGDTQEVIDMFNQYKEWKSKQTKEQPARRATDSRDDVKSEIAVPASPGGPRVPRTVDKNDFDAAWEEATRSG